MGNNDFFRTVHELSVRATDKTGTTEVVPVGSSRSGLIQFTGYDLVVNQHSDHLVLDVLSVPIGRLLSLCAFTYASHFG